MAVPQVISFSPTRGHTGGQVFVAFIGSGFKLPEPTTGFPRPPQAPSVTITFGGVPAHDIQVVDEETLTCLAPVCPLVNDKGVPIPGLVDVVITNIDTAGAPIPGESVTLSAAFEYLRPNLGTKSFPQWVLECLMRQLILQVVERVDFAVHTDYRDDGEAIDFERIPDAPCLVITDLEFTSSTPRDAGGEQEIELENGRVVRRRAPAMKDLELSIAGIANTTMEILSMMTALDLLFRKGHKLRVPRTVGSTDFVSNVIELDLEYAPLQAMRVTAGGSESNIKSFAKLIAIRGVPFEEIPGLPPESTSEVPDGIAGESVFGITFKVDEFNLDFSKKESGGEE